MCCADVGAGFHAEFLGFAVDHLFEALGKQAFGILFKQRVPIAIPTGP